MLRPLTEEYLSQRFQSLSGFERYWYEVLQSGMFDRYYDWDNPNFKSTKSLTDYHKDCDKNAGRYNPNQQQQIASTLKIICPSAVPARKKILNTQERGYELPDIKLARKEFETMLGTSVECEELDDVATVVTTFIYLNKKKGFRKNFSNSSGNSGNNSLTALTLARIYILLSSRWFR